MAEVVNVGSLFSGIGGFDLGFERTGMRTAFFVERDRYCQAVLRKRWPGVPIFDEVESVGAHNLPAVDLLCGGFPCQDISGAGKRVGIDGARSGLWSEFHRIIGELRPRYVVVENVADLRSRGLGRILGEMAAIGYDAEWDCIPACAVGAPHRRDRIWIVAYPQQSGLEGLGGVAGEAQEPESRDGGALADANDAGPAHVQEGQARRDFYRDDRRWHAADSGDLARWTPAQQWATEPDVGRVAHGVPNRVDRLRAIGNALIPQIAEWIGQQIIEWEALT